MGAAASPPARSCLCSPTGASPEPHRSLTVAPLIQIRGATVRLRGGPRDGPVQRWTNRGPQARLSAFPISAFRLVVLGQWSAVGGQWSLAHGPSVPWSFGPRFPSLLSTFYFLLSQCQPSPARPPSSVFAVPESLSPSVPSSSLPAFLLTAFPISAFRLVVLGQWSAVGGQ